jgi:hypothetical protein
MLTLNSSMQSQAVGPCVGPSSELSSSETARIRAEYVEMPGLSLTALQAARLWGLGTLRSQQVLSMLTTLGAPAVCVCPSTSAKSSTRDRPCRSLFTHLHHGQLTPKWRPVRRAL